MTTPSTKTIACALAAAVLASSAGAAHAGSLDDLKRRVGKYASDIAEPYRSPCVCLNAGEVYGRGGVLRYGVIAPTATTRQVTVWCEAVTFAYSDGTPELRTNCSDYALLAK